MRNGDNKNQEKMKNKGALEISKPEEGSKKEKQRKLRTEARGSSLLGRRLRKMIEGEDKSSNKANKSKNKEGIFFREKNRIKSEKRPS